MSEVSTQPYLMRAIYEWCTDQGFTPYISVHVNGATQVPMEFVKDGNIVLNIAFGATSNLLIDNDAVKFKARFGGVSRDIYVPIRNVLAIFASENGQGMSFRSDADVEEMYDEGEMIENNEHQTDIPSFLAEVKLNKSEVSSDKTEKTEKKFKKPSLTIVK